MIPYKLELKNFLSYGPLQTIDFNEYSLICLSGKNGHGKSALLDAITWSLWGSARKVSSAARADEGLVRLGQTSMMVSLEFSVRDQYYRVRREFSKLSTRNYATLDFEIFDKAKDSFVSLTDKTIKETQEKVIAAVGLDFETFINTAFVRQGHSNEFSQKNPKERKSILSSILGLARYDLMRAQALEQARERNDEKNFLQHVITHGAQEIAKQQQLDQEKMAAEKELAETESAFVVVHKKQEQHQAQQVVFMQRMQELKLLELQLQKSAQEKGHAEVEVRSLYAQWKSVHAQMLAFNDHVAISEKRKKLLVEEQQLLLAQRRTLELQEKMLETKTLYQRIEMQKIKRSEELHQEKKAALEKLVMQHNQATFMVSQRVLSLQEGAQKIERMNQELATYDSLLVAAGNDQTQRAKIEAQFEKRRSFYQQLVQQGNAIKLALEECEHKKEVVHDRDNPTCPTCEQILTVRRKEFLQSKFLKQESLLRHQEARIRRVLARLKELLFAQHEVIKKMVLQSDQHKEHSLRREHLAAQQVLLHKEHALNVQALSELQEEQGRLGELHEHAHKVFSDELNISKALLEHDEELGALRKQCLDLEAERKALIYDALHHKKISDELKTLEQYLQALERRAQLEKEQQGRRDTISAVIVQLKKIKQERALLALRVASLTPTAEEQALLASTGEELKGQLQVLLARKEQLREELGRTVHELTRLEKLKEESAVHQKRCNELTIEADEYQTLATILGKDGVQAVLIEEAIPEIEQEANVLLAQLSDNNAQILIESLRDLKKGGVKETLDINISDLSGIRPYELFSGGEAFRIDFALRIAISKLLARRAGAHLQTLIIDEGFGSQDEEGLQRLMEAIYTVTDNFSRIIIVSHLPIFKDNFPVHFVVEKTAQGSAVSVVERG